MIAWIVRVWAWLRGLFTAAEGGSVPVLYVHMPELATLSPEYVPRAQKLLPGVVVRVVHDRTVAAGVSFSALGFDLQPEHYRQLTDMLDWSFPEGAA